MLKKGIRSFMSAVLCIGLLSGAVLSQPVSEVLATDEETVSAVSDTQPEREPIVPDVSAGYPDGVEPVTVSEAQSDPEVPEGEAASSEDETVSAQNFLSAESFSSVNETVLEEIDVSYSWQIDEGVLTISGSGAVDSFTAASSQPWYDQAASIVKIVISDGITGIGARAFEGLVNVTDAELADSIESIGFRAFADCTALAKINIPVNWNSSPSSASDGTTNTTYCGHIFDGDTSLLHLDVPEGMSALPSYAFNGADHLQSVTLPSTLTEIKNHTFFGCTSLKSITIPDTVSAIGKSAFFGCSSLNEVFIPDNVITLDLYVFGSCTGLTKAALSDNIESIGYRAFADCTSLVEINIPKNWKECPSTATDGTTNTTYCGHIFDGDTSLLHLDVPEGMSALPSYAFNGADHLQSVTLPSTLTEIQNHTFYGCTSLKSVTIPDTVSTIGKSAFYGCTSLSEIKIPDNVISLGSFVFDSCTGLTKAVLSDNIESIGYRAFADCTLLAEISIPKSWKECPSNATDGIINTTYCGHIFDGDISLMHLDVPEGMSALPSFAFNGADHLQSVTLPSTLTQIKNQAFYGCSSLTGIEIPDSVTEIWKSAFYGCSSLSEAFIPDNVVSLGSFVFDSCTSLTKAVLSDKIESIGYRAFAGCTSLVDINIPKSWKECPSNAKDGTINETYCGHIFEADTNLLCVEVPEGMTSLPDYAFCACDTLVYVTLPETLTSIGKGAFYNCTSLVSADIPEKIKVLPDSLFRGCSALMVVNIGTSVETIEGNVFTGCDALTQINYSGNETKWEDITVNTTNTAKLSEVKILHDYHVKYTDRDFTGTFEGEYDGQHNNDIVVRRHFIINFSECKHLNGNVYEIKGDMTFSPSHEINSPYALTGSYYIEGLVDLSTGAMMHQGYEWIKKPDHQGSLIYIPFNGMLSPDKKFISGINSHIRTRTYEAIRLGFSLNSKTQVILSDESGSYNLITERVSYEENSSGEATIVVKPDWQKNDPGRILLYTTDIALESATGVFLDIRPGELFKPYTPVYVILEDSQGNIVESKRVKLEITKPPVTRFNIPLDSASLHVYENKKSSTKLTDDYRLSEGVLVEYGSGVDQTNQNGYVSLPASAHDTVKFSKEGYITREIKKKRLDKSGNVYLQKVNDAGPVISAVWVDDIDVLNEAYDVNMLSKEAISLELEIDWGKSKAGTVKLTQKSASAAFNGNTLTLIFSDRFDTSSAIYIEAEDDDGRVSKKELKFENAAQNAVIKKLQGASFEISDKISISLPDDFEPSLFAGQTFGVSIDGIESVLPVHICAEDGKFYISLGLDIISYSKKTKTTTDRETGEKVKSKPETEVKNFIKRFKESGILDAKDAKDGLKKLKNIKKEFKDAIAKPTGTFAVEADFTVLGFLEGTFDEDGTLHFLDTGLILNPSLSISRDWPFVLMAGPIPIPMSFETSFNLDVTGTGNIRLNNTAKNYVPNINLSGDITLSGGVIAGVKKLLYAGGGLKGHLDTSWDINIGKTNYFEIKPGINAYVKAGIAWFEGEYEFEPRHEFILVRYRDGEWSWFENKIPAVPMITFEPKDLSYLDQNSIFSAETFNGTQASILNAQSHVQGNTIKTNVYRETTPEMADLGDGTKVLVWLDSDSSDYNSVNLYYSVCQNGIWSSPKIVEDDGTTDNTPVLKVINGRAYLAWQDAVKAFGDDELTLEQTAPHFDISTAVFDEETGTFRTYAIANEHIDMIPDLCGNEENIYAVWVNNSEDDWFGNNESNSILLSRFDGTSWSEPEELYSGLFSVNSVGADVQDELKVAYTVDTDGNQATVEDNRVFENGVVVSEDSMSYGPVYVNHDLYWNTGNNIVNRDYADSVNAIIIANYRLLDAGSETVLVYTKPDGLGSGLYLSYFNEETNSWSEGSALTDSSSFIGAFAACMDENNELFAVVNTREIIGDWGDDEVYGNSDLIVLTPEKFCDISAGEVYYMEDNFTAGADMPMYVDLTNEGNIPVNAQRIEVRDAENNLLSETEVCDLIAPGDTVTVSFHYPVPENVTSHDITVTSIVDTYTDVSPENNSTSVHLSYERSFIEDDTYGYRDDGVGVIYGNVVNRGYEPKSNLSVSLHKDTVDSEALETKTIETLNPLEPVHVEFERELSQGETYYLVLKDSEGKIEHYDFVHIMVKETPYVAIESITLNETSLNLETGETAQLNAQVNPENADNTEVFWQSTDASVASVDQNGLVTAIHAGTAVISAEADGKKAECNVTVTDPESQETLSVSVTPEELNIVYGQTQSISVAVEPADAQYSITFESDNPAIAEADENGNVTAKAVGTAAIRIMVNEIEKTVPVRVLFTDVANGSQYFYTPVYWAVDNGITVGAGGPGKFSPTASCTREQFVTFLWRQQGKPSYEKGCDFSDVPEDAWYYEPISWAAENGITTGLNDGTGRFGVGQACTREQCVAFLHRAADSPEPEGSIEFTDSLEGRYYYKAIKWAAGKGITVGLNDGTGRFGVGQKCTRGMLVTFLYRFANQ